MMDRYQGHEAASCMGAELKGLRTRTKATAFFIFPPCISDLRLKLIHPLCNVVHLLDGEQCSFSFCAVP